jgi:dTDP-4-dehydrorhamnose 3,5-epimerase-like enzyme
VSSRRIDGVQVKPLRVVPDERGWLLEVLRADDELFTRFGQVYVSATYPGVVKRGITTPSRPTTSRASAG